MFKDIFFFDRITRKKFFESKKPFSGYTQMKYIESKLMYIQIITSLLAYFGDKVIA